MRGEPLKIVELATDQIRKTISEASRTIRTQPDVVKVDREANWLIKKFPNKYYHLNNFIQDLTSNKIIIPTYVLKIPEYKISMAGNEAYLTRQSANVYDTGKKLIPFTDDIYVDSTHIDYFLKLKNEEEQLANLISNQHNLLQNCRLFKLEEATKKPNCDKSEIDKLNKIIRFNSQSVVEKNRSKVAKEFYPALVELAKKLLNNYSQLYTKHEPDPDLVLVEAPAAYRLNTFLKQDYSVVGIQSERNYGEADGLILNDTLCEKYQIKSTTNAEDKKIEQLLKTLWKVKYIYTDTNFLIVSLLNELYLIDRLSNCENIKTPNLIESIYTTRPVTNQDYSNIAQKFDAETNLEFQNKSLNGNLIQQIESTIHHPISSKIFFNRLRPENLQNSNIKQFFPEKQSTIQLYSKEDTAKEITQKANKAATVKAINEYGNNGKPLKPSQIKEIEKKKA